MASAEPPHVPVIPPPRFFFGVALAALLFYTVCSWLARCVFGLLGYALILPQRRRPRRIVAINFMIAIILAIGFSRMYLRAHWFSDVVGGWSLGLAWLFLCLGWLERGRRRQSLAA